MRITRSDKKDNKTVRPQNRKSALDCHSTKAFIGTYYQVSEDICAAGKVGDKELAVIL